VVAVVVVVVIVVEVVTLVLVVVANVPVTAAVYAAPKVPVATTLSVIHATVILTLMVRVCRCGRPSLDVNNCWRCLHHLRVRCHTWLVLLRVSWRSVTRRVSLGHWDARLHVSFLRFPIHGDRTSHHDGLTDHVYGLMRRKGA